MIFSQSSTPRLKATLSASNPSSVTFPVIHHQRAAARDPPRPTKPRMSLRSCHSAPVTPVQNVTHSTYYMTIFPVTHPAIWNRSLRRDVEVRARRWVVCRLSSGGGESRGRLDVLGGGGGRLFMLLFVW